MAIYHCSIKIIGGGKGRSAVAPAAYRAGEKITSEYDGTIHNCTRKGCVVHTEILLPDHAPAGFTDRVVLWNAVEKREQHPRRMQDMEYWKTARLIRTAS